eukprot:3696174-Alexandrium_andersonii.AAC.1
MSASLVGSEMCIRDRTPRDWRLRRARPHRGPPRLAPPPVRAASPRGLPCLLYTSDAADDM